MNVKQLIGFGTIRNNTALKPIERNRQTYQRFWNHSKQHSSKTETISQLLKTQFWNHSKQHSSKTHIAVDVVRERFWNHSKQHSSKTYKLVDLQQVTVLEPFETTQL